MAAYLKYLRGSTCVPVRICNRARIFPRRLISRDGIVLVHRCRQSSSVVSLLARSPARPLFPRRIAMNIFFCFTNPAKQAVPTSRSGIRCCGNSCNAKAYVSEDRSEVLHTEGAHKCKQMLEQRVQWHRKRSADDNRDAPQSKLLCRSVTTTTDSTLQT